MYYVNRDPRNHVSGIGVLYCTSDKSHRRYEDWRATGVPQIDRSYFGDRISKWPTLSDYHRVRPGPLLRIIMILLYSVSICLITIGTSVF
jgi:hypothetical protein